MLAVSAAAALIALALAAALLLLAPQRLYPPLTAAQLKEVTDPEQRITLQQAQGTLQNEVRTVLLQALGGSLLLVGALATWRQVQVSREGQITDRFTSAVEQLGSGAADIRIGGIHALERIARNSPRDRSTITEILTAYVTHHASWPGGEPDHPDHRPGSEVDMQLPWLRTRAPDVQAALTVLGRRPPDPDDPRLVLFLVDLRRAYFAGARLTRIRLRRSNLTRAWLRTADLRRADLSEADLRHAEFRQANLANAYLRGTLLQHADLSMTTLTDAVLADARLQHALLTDADLTGADLSGADLTGAHLDGATLTGVNLSGADLTGVDLDGVDLAGVDLTGARLDGATMDGADPAGALPDGANLTDRRSGNQDDAVNAGE